jgi:Zn-dependent protease/CBS domain-containing protein
MGSDGRTRDNTAMTNGSEQESISGTFPRRPAGGGMIANSYRLFTIAGIEVGVHVSWLVIFGLVTWSLASSYFPAVLTRSDPLERWVLGALSAILLFASVLIHELAHSFLAKARGLEARSITLFIFGGVSSLSGETKRPSTEFVVAIVGPLTSLVLSGIAYAVAVAAPRASPVAAIAGYLAAINGVLGLFNLIPGFPLDGGRVLRAIIWQVTRDSRRSTELATAVGRLVAWGFVLWGFWLVLNDEVFRGIWIVAIGWFLQNAASASLEQTVAEQRLRRLRVGDVVRPDPTAVPSNISVAELVERYMLPGARRSIPVVDGDRVVGIVTLSDVRHVPPEQRPTTLVRSIMGGREGLATVTPGTPLRDAIDALGSGDYEQVPVVQDGRLVGLLTRADVVRQIQLREALQVQSAGDAA